MFTPPSRRERWEWATFYGFIFLSGVLVLSLPPRTIEGPLGEFMTTIWGALLSLSIIPATASVLGRFKWEYAALPIVIAGVLIYALTVWYLALVDTPTRSAQAALITAIAVGLGRRWSDRRELIRRDKIRHQRADPR